MASSIPAQSTGTFKFQRPEDERIESFQICVYWLDCLKSGDCKITACSPGRKSRCEEGKKVSFFWQTTSYSGLLSELSTWLWKRFLIPHLGIGSLLERCCYLFPFPSAASSLPPSLLPFSCCCKIDWGKVGKEWCSDHPNSSWGRRLNLAALECSFVHSDPKNLVLLGRF